MTVIVVVVVVVVWCCVVVVTITSFDTWWKPNTPFAKQTLKTIIGEPPQNHMGRILMLVHAKILCGRWWKCDEDKESGIKKGIVYTERIVFLNHRTGKINLCSLLNFFSLQEILVIMLQLVQSALNDSLKVFQYEPSRYYRTDIDTQKDYSTWIILPTSAGSCRFIKYQTPQPRLSFFISCHRHIQQKGVCRTFEK